MFPKREEDGGKPLEGRRIVVTGRLASMSREEAVNFIEFLGGSYLDHPGEDTDTVVVGSEGWPLRSGGHITRSLEEARRLQESGHPIRIVPESDFLESLGFEGEEFARLYPLEELARIVDVDPLLVRRWMRQGLLTPVKTLRRLAWFDFRQVAAARSLRELLDSGVSQRQLAENVKRIRSWLPEALPGMEVEVEEDGERFLVRFSDGSLAEPGGQLCLDFEKSPEAAPSDPRELPIQERSAEDWFGLGLEWDEEGRYEEALRAWHNVLRLEGGVSPEAAFNMGNALYRLGRKGEALQRFMQAVEQDGDYVQAWNNLGSVLDDLDREEDALEAYRAAVDADPGYADPYFNLAEILHRMGRTDEARPHWQSYLQRDPESPWADQVRARLRGLLQGGVADEDHKTSG